MHLQGIGVSPGIGIGTAYVVKEREIDVSKKAAGPDECMRFVQAAGRLGEILSNRASAASGERADILESHMAVLSDPAMQAEIEGILQREHCNCEYAVETVFEAYAESFRQSDDELLRMRAGDLRDIKNNLLAVMNGFDLPDIGLVPKGSILVADELSASLAAGIPEGLVNGLVTNVGGRTSHMAIIARSLGLCAVTGISQIEHGELLIVNGDTGEVIVHPTEEALSKCRVLTTERRIAQAALLACRGVPGKTIDGRQIALCANVGLEMDIQKAVAADAEGIGLFRTEFLFMNRSSAPSEEEQFAVYKKAAQAFGKSPVIIRTLDIGGDKAVPYLGLEKEANSFLGWRGIRYCIDHEDIFAAQLRAILRASAFGYVKIMFPMIADIQELRYAKMLISRLKAELLDQGIAFDQNIPVGIMIETPAAAVLAGAFAKEADFFSIGTNDLTQYTLAADRSNQKAEKLYSAYHPAVLRLICHTAKQAGLHHIPCGVCGEAGADPLLTKFLVGCGVSELSMSGDSILSVRSVICQMVYEETRKKIEKSLDALTDTQDSLAFLHSL